MDKIKSLIAALLGNAAKVKAQPGTGIGPATVNAISGNAEVAEAMAAELEATQNRVAVLEGSISTLTNQVAALEAKLNAPSA